MKNPIWKKNTLFFEHPDIFGISFDSRTIQPGDMFFALKDSRDGHDFVLDAMNKGAACAIVEKKICHNNIVVDSPLETLVQIAKLRRKMLNAEIICVTGSVGKTTTKEALICLLTQAGKKVYGTEKNYNNLIGLSVTLAKMPIDIEYLVLEIGTSSFGEIDQLASIIKPDYSLITHIAPAHFQHFNSLKNILHEKADIIKHTTKRTFFNKNIWYSEQLQKLATYYNVLYSCFENEKDNMNTLKNAWKMILKNIQIECDPDKFSIYLPGRKNIFQSNFNGLHCLVIDSSYNSNPTSMLESINFARKIANEEENKKLKKIAILYSMTGIGAHSKRYHESLSCYFEDFDLFLLGDEMKWLMEKRRKNNKQAEWFDNLESLKYRIKNIQEDSLIFIKSSQNKLAEIVEMFK